MSATANTDDFVKDAAKPAPAAVEIPGELWMLWSEEGRWIGGTDGDPIERSALLVYPSRRLAENAAQDCRDFYNNRCEVVRVK